MKKTYIIPQVEDVQLDELMQTFGIADQSTPLVSPEAE